MANNNIHQMLKFMLSLFFIAQIIATTPINISLQSVSDLLIQSALNSLNEDNIPSGHMYKGGNLISAQKLVNTKEFPNNHSINLIIIIII